jgi:hypothetical protein
MRKLDTVLVLVAVASRWKVPAGTETIVRRAARVTTTVYALVAPLWAVTVIVAVCGTPTTKLLRVWGAETLAFASAFVPVTVSEITEFAMLTV